MISSATSNAEGRLNTFAIATARAEETREGIAGTVVTDEVEYELPLGLLGEIANTLVMKRQMRALFAYRQKMLPALLVI